MRNEGNLEVFVMHTDFDFFVLPRILFFWGFSLYIRTIQWWVVNTFNFYSPQKVNQNRDETFLGEIIQKKMPNLRHNYWSILFYALLPNWGLDYLTSSKWVSLKYFFPISVLLTRSKPFPSVSTNLQRKTSRIHVSDSQTPT